MKKRSFVCGRFLTKHGRLFVLVSVVISFIKEHVSPNWFYSVQNCVPLTVNSMSVSGPMFLLLHPSKLGKLAKCLVYGRLGLRGRSDVDDKIL